MARFAHYVPLRTRSLRQVSDLTHHRRVSLALGMERTPPSSPDRSSACSALLPVKNPEQLVQLWVAGSLRSNTGRIIVLPHGTRTFRSPTRLQHVMFCTLDQHHERPTRGKTDRVHGETLSGTYFPGGSRRCGLVWASCSHPAITRNSSKATPPQPHRPYLCPIFDRSALRWRPYHVLGAKLLVNGFPDDGGRVSQAGFNACDPL